MNHALIQSITDFGDSSLILPLSCLLGLALWGLESGRAAWTFARALLVCLGAMTLLKIAFISCGHSLGAPIESPSGHTSFAAFFYASLATLVYARRSKLGLAAYALALAAIGAIGVSRLMLGAHNLPEVLLGGSVGLACTLFFARPYLKQPHPRRYLSRLALLFLPVFLLCYGKNLPAEQTLRSLIPELRPAVCKG